MVKFSGMTLVLTALAATRQCAAFGVGSLRTSARSFTRLAASDNDFDDFSSKVSLLSMPLFSSSLHHAYFGKI
jgi:hypothetical protein